jgi:hypothetical protein
MMEPSSYVQASKRTILLQTVRTTVRRDFSAVLGSSQARPPFAGLATSPRRGLSGGATWGACCQFWQRPGWARRHPIHKRRLLPDLTTAGGTVARVCPHATLRARGSRIPAGGHQRNGCPGWQRTSRVARRFWRHGDQEVKAPCAAPGETIRRYERR